MQGIISVIIIFLLMNYGAHSQEELHTKERSEVSDKYKWDLTDLYPSDESWTEAKKKVLEQIDEIPSFKGTLGESSSKMLDCFKFIDEISLFWPDPFYSSI